MWASSSAMLMGHLALLPKVSTEGIGAAPHKVASTGSVTLSSCTWIPGRSNALASQPHIRIWCLLAHSPHTSSWSIAEGQTGTSDKKLAFQELVKFNIASVALDRFPASLPEASGLVKLTSVAPAGS